MSDNNGNGNNGTPALKSLVDGDEDGWLRLCAGVGDPNVSNALAQIGAMLASMKRRNNEHKLSIAQLEERALASWPDASIEVDAQGRPALVLKKGNTTIRQRIGLNDQGVYRQGVSYVRGDVVTHNRSLFICRVDHPTGRPEDASGHWRLCVMRGRDGKDGKDGTVPTEGEP